MINEIIVLFKRIIDKLGMGFGFLGRGPGGTTIFFNGLISLCHRFQDRVDLVEVIISESLLLIWLMSVFFVVLLIRMNWTR